MGRSPLVILLLAAACRSSAPENPAPAGTLNAEVGRISIQQFELQDLRGISGLAGTGSGAFWLVPERERRLIRVEVRDGVAAVTASLTIRGAPDGQDLESIAVLSPSSSSTLAFGTETMKDRTADAVVLGRVFGDEVVIDADDPWTLDYAPWAIKPPENRGLEALCSSGGRLLAISEAVKTVERRRYAPLAVRDANEASWRRRLLTLTSVDGKISGVACRVDGAGRLHGIAIERHYGVMRLLRFTVPEPEAGGGPNDPIETTVLADVARAYASGAPPNFEGIEWTDDTTLWLVSDNDYGGVSGATILLKVGLPAPAPTP